MILPPCLHGINMDEKLQKEIREFNPSDANITLWSKLTKVYPLFKILETCPLDQLSLAQSLNFAGKLLIQINEKIAEQKRSPVNTARSNQRSKEPRPISSVNGQVITSVERGENISSFFEKFSKLLIDASELIIEDGKHSAAIGLNTYCDYDRYDEEFEELDLTLHISNWRLETEAEVEDRLNNLKASQKKAKETRLKREAEEKKKVEAVELAEYQRLKKKFESK